MWLHNHYDIKFQLYTGQRGQNSASSGATAAATGGGSGGQDRGKDKERTRPYALSNIRHPPPPPTTTTASTGTGANGGGGSSSAAAAASGSSSSASAVEEDSRARGGGRREEQVYDRSPKLQHRGGRQGAEKVYELLSKAKASRQDRDRERENKGGQSPGSVERQMSATGGGEGAAVYAKPKRQAPPPPGSGGGAKKGGGASFEVQISEGPPDYSAVMGGRDVSDTDVFESIKAHQTLSLSLSLFLLVHTLSLSPARLLQNLLDREELNRVQI